MSVKKNNRVIPVTWTRGRIFDQEVRILTIPTI